MNPLQQKILIYQDQRGKEPFGEWVKSLSRTDRARVFARLDRVEAGNFGDYKAVGEGVHEFRLHFGAGYRIYFGRIEQTIILLLGGGDKSTQEKDIRRAQEAWKNYLERSFS